MNLSSLLLAQTTTQSFEFARMQNEWEFLLGCVVLGVLVVFAVLVYIRDAVELPWYAAVLLCSLRLSAFGLLFWIWLSPQMRVVVEHKQNSRAVVMVDASQSMSTRDSLPELPNTGPTRSELVRQALNQDKLLDKLRKNHDVLVLKFFDQELSSVVNLPRIEPQPTGEAGATTPAPQGTSLGLDAQGKPIVDPLTAIDWNTAIEPQGKETRLGEALRQTLIDLRSGVLAGVVVFSDGQSNVGIAPESVIPLAKESGAAIIPVGVGGTNEPINVRIANLLVPPRVYPGDEFEVKAYVLSTGPGSAGRNVKVHLTSKTAGKDTPDDTISETREVTLPGPGQEEVLTFRMEASQLGRRVIEVKVDPIKGDAYPKDDARSAEVEVIEQRTKVLLLAGGPSREYQFLRNQLFRDKTTEVDVYLQIYQQGMSQDARNILTEFPSTAAELSEYDAIVAFDPDWKALKPAQVDLLEAWVAEQSGGLVAAAGPVYTEKWTQAPEMQKIRALYPVEFNRRFSLLDSGRFDNRDARPLEISRAGADAQFLWIEDSPEMSQRAWNNFDGVYGYYSVRGAKDGATVYARFADPDAASEAQPIYFAGQIYGSGRVFYMGSSEMWRLRATDEAYFERFWTKLIRYVSQERMRRGAKRGVLLVERDTYDLGQPVQVSAQVRTQEQKPLDAPSVDLDVLNPNGSPMRVQLKPSKSGGPGTFAGQFTPREPGSYRIEVVIPDAAEEDRLAHQIEVTLPDLELRNNVRNDAVLSRLAAETGGTYIIGADKAGQVVDLLPPKTKTELQLERPISQWDRPWVLAAIVSLLSLEWILRRLLKLA